MRINAQSKRILENPLKTKPNDVHDHCDPMDHMMASSDCTHRHKVTPRMPAYSCPNPGVQTQQQAQNEYPCEAVRLFHLLQATAQRVVIQTECHANDQATRNNSGTWLPCNAAQTLPAQHLSSARPERHTSAASDPKRSCTVVSGFQPQAAMQQHQL